MSTLLKILLPTDEEEAKINAGILSDPDSFELNQQELEVLQATKKVLPDVVAAYQRSDFKQGQQKTVSLILSIDMKIY